MKKILILLVILLSIGLSGYLFYRDYWVTQRDQHQEGQQEYSQNTDQFAPFNEWVEEQHPECEVCEPCDCSKYQQALNVLLNYNQGSINMPDGKVYTLGQINQLIINATKK